MRLKAHGIVLVECPSQYGPRLRIDHLEGESWEGSSVQFANRFAECWSPPFFLKSTHFELEFGDPPQ